MNKELTALRALKDIGKLKENGCYVNTTIEYEIVETALKNYEELTSKPVILCRRTHGEAQKTHRYNL